MAGEFPLCCLTSRIIKPDAMENTRQMLILVINAWHYP